MKLDVKGLKCDYCTYKDMSIESKDYKNNIDKPCPICGKSLLTQEDYDYFCRVEKWVKRLNILKWINPFYYLGLLFPKSQKLIKVELEGHVPNINKNKNLFISYENCDNRS